MGILSNKDLKVGILLNLPAKPSKGEDIDYVSEAEVEDQAEMVQEALEKLSLGNQRFYVEDDIEELVGSLKEYKPDVIVNLCEGAFGDSHLEMDVPSILELLGIPYTGSPPLSLGLCQNKGLTKNILRSIRVPVPDYQILTSYEFWKGSIDYPLFVKPLREDASLGISRDSFVKNDSELKKRVKYIAENYRQPALVEKYIEGRELNVAILGNEKPKVLPISEIIFGFDDEPKIVSYTAKWFKNSDEYKKTEPICPARLNESTKKKIENVAILAYGVLCCRDYARIDIRLKNGIPYILEVNPNPDISLEAGFVRSLRTAGIPFEEFVGRIVGFALERKFSRINY